MPTVPEYPASSSSWTAVAPTLHEIAASGSTVAARNQAQTIIYRELCARWWVSIWDVNPAPPSQAEHTDIPAPSPHPAFRALGIAKGADPTDTNNWTPITNDGGDATGGELIVFEPGAPARCSAVRRSSPRSASIWSAVVAELVTEADALIASES